LGHVVTRAGSNRKRQGDWKPRGHGREAAVEGFNRLKCARKSGHQTLGEGGGVKKGKVDEKKKSRADGGGGPEKL